MYFCPIMVDTFVNIQALKDRTANDVSLATTLLEMFIKEKDEYIATIKNECLNHNTEGLRKIIHKVKGIVGTFGFDKLVEDAIIINNEAYQNIIDDEKVSDFCISIENHIFKLKEIIKKWDCSIN